MLPLDYKNLELLTMTKKITFNRWTHITFKYCHAINAPTINGTKRIISTTIIINMTRTTMHRTDLTETAITNGG